MMKEKKHTLKLSVQDIALIGMMTAVIEVSKLALSFLPNVELVTFWIIMFTLFFGPKVIYSILVFILIEISIYGIQTWVIMYLYIWPALALLVYLFRKNNSIWFYSILSGLYGLLFGAFCSIPYIVIGSVGGGIRSGLLMAFNWWVAGIPFDILHGISNFALMLVLYVPVRELLNLLRHRHHFF
ncbi:MAG: hypothetical protein ACI4TB_01485 [Lachnospiraceae bacterium]